MKNLFSLESVITTVNDAAIAMVAAYQELNKRAATPAQNKKFAYSVMAFDLALETHGVESFTEFDAASREAILELHKATVHTAYKAITEDLVK